MRIVFMGSPAFALPSLRALAAAGHSVSLVITQAARPAGRGRRETEPPVARAARDMGIPVQQPERVRSPDTVDAIAREQPDAIVVVAYGQILPPSVLDIPRVGCVNVHASLLPRHRGASPVSAAILAGDELTGLSIMLMDEGMDTGPVLSQLPTPISRADDQVTLSARLSAMGAALLVDTLGPLERGEIELRPQDESLATTTRRVRREDGLLDWQEPAEALWRRARAYAEWPHGFTRWDGRLLRVLRADYDDTVAGEPGVVVAYGPTGRGPTGAAIYAGRGALVPLVLGLEGRDALPIDAFLRGQRRFIGARLRSSDSPPDLTS